MGRGGKAAGSVNLSNTAIASERAIGDGIVHNINIFGEQIKMWHICTKIE